MAEAIGVGASVVTFLGLALSSAKAIYEVLSAVNDGPRIVQRLAGEVKQHKTILLRLSELQINTINSADLQELESFSKRCEADLTSFNKKLRQISFSENDRRIGKLWKRLKIAVTEKDLDRMRDIVQHNTTFLNAQLGILTAAQMSAFATQMSVSAPQLAEMLDILRQLRPEGGAPCISTPPAQTASTDAVEEAMPDATPEPDPLETKFQESIDRLIALVKEKECTVESDDAEQLISDLQTLLESAQAKEVSPVPAETATGVSEITMVERESNVLKELKLASSLIFCAPSIAINSTGAVVDVVKHMPQGAILQQQRKRKVIDIGGGSLTVETNKRRRVYGGRDVTTDDEGGSGRDFTAKLLFKDKNARTLLSIAVRQGQILSGSFLSIPRVLLSNIIPYGSLVFHIARYGQVEELMSLVAEGKASLHDRDTYGWSVLHYAAYNENAPMTQFLVQHGLDPDDTTSSICSVNHRRFTPLHHAVNVASHESLTVLLAAGADPTVDTNGVSAAIYWLATSMFPRCNPKKQSLPAGEDCLTMLDLVFRHSQHFGPSTVRDEFGRTLFLSTIARQPVIEDSDIKDHIRELSFLLDRGCSVTDVDHNGSNCLHIFFSSAPYPCQTDMRDLLIRIIRQGADVYARDRWGRSVSQIAYSTSCISKLRDYGTRPGDLWDAILDSCGYNVSEFRKGYPRRAVYTDEYSRLDFERLWEGREQRCPYWDDADWHSPEDGGHVDIPWSGEEVICVCGSPDCWRLPDSSSEAADNSEEDESGSYSGSEYAGSEDDVDLLEERHQPSAFTEDSRRAQTPEDSATELDDFDQGRHQKHYFRYDAEKQTRELDELFHSPWEDHDVPFTLDNDTGSVLDVSQREFQGFSSSTHHPSGYRSELLLGEFLSARG
ncbi:ankyrin [Coniochaeta sp. PMI_546]|nr:ankyrin [Coniochaeta sp. PMI_546]